MALEIKTANFSKEIAGGLIVAFTLDEGRYGLHLAAVERITRMVEITALPRAPEIVLGAINVEGNIIPVVNVRRRFGLPPRELKLSDHLILARTSRRKVALATDGVAGVVRPEETITADRICPRLPHMEGVVKGEDGLILIYDLDLFLSLEEEKALDQAII